MAAHATARNPRNAAHAPGRLAEEQQQEGHQHGLEQELETQEGEQRVDDARREDDDADETKVTLSNNNFTEVAKIVLEGVGGPENVASIDNCITRLRLEVKIIPRSMKS